uniref:CSON002701 protein n=1 Tax=Culicoides sonorensis TaxID=179676 RepID=A0A336MXK3_CULSO
MSLFHFNSFKYQKSWSKLQVAWFCCKCNDYAAKNNCSTEKFALFFWDFIKLQTEDFTKINSSACNTPKKSGLTSTNLRQTPQNFEQTQIHVPPNEFQTRQNISRELFSMSQNMCVNSSPKENNNFHSYSNRSHGNVNENNVVLNTSNEMDKKNRRSFELNSNKRDKKDNTMIAFNERKMNVITSTPVNSGGNKRNTPNNSNSLRKSAGGGGGSGGSPMCLGDFIVGPMKTKRRSLNTEPKSDNAPSQSTNNEQSSSIKPKKRVAPIMLSKNVSKSDFSNNAFVIDDNFAVKPDELLPAPYERHLLKMNRDAITQDFMEQSHELNAKTLHLMEM